MPKAIPLTTIGACVRAMRLRRGLTKSELARALHLRHNSIGRYETNQRHPAAERLQRIADILDLPIAYLYPRVWTCAELARITPLPRGEA